MYQDRGTLVEDQITQTPPLQKKAIKIKKKKLQMERQHVNASNKLITDTRIGILYLRQTRV